MFENFFGLSENPFRLTPDPKFLFLSDVHKEALSHLRYGIEQRMGFVMVTGEVGTGKTTICRQLLKSLDSQVHTALILHPALSDIELLESINRDFGLAAAADTKKGLMDELFDFLLEVNGRGENAVLIIDEGQNLDPAVLEQVRMLSNLETENQKLLQILLLGQPELGEMLACNNLRQLSDRIVVRYHMGPLNRGETRDYIMHRLSVAGAQGGVRFSAGALRQIYRYSGGLPRKINAVCERALLLTYLKGSHTVTAGLVKQAINELKGVYAVKSRWPIWLAGGCGAAAVVGVALAVILSPQIGKGRATSEAPAASAALAQPVAASPARPVGNSWVIASYDEALGLLLRQPGLAAAGTQVLRLRPAPEMLVYFRQPFIVGLASGYAVVVAVDEAGLEVLDLEQRSHRLPFRAFKQRYAWSVVLNYSGNRQGVYRLNSAGPAVKLIQERLRALGYIAIEPDGYYGIDTARAIERLQEVYGLRRDGVAGGETLALLEVLEAA